MSDENSDTLTIKRIFNAPVEKVWKYWSDAENTKKWWGPKMFTCPVSRIDFRVGGTYLNCMRSPDGKDYWSTGKYLEIVPMKKIVVTDSFADEKGNVVSASHYGMEEMPIQLTVSIAFETLDNGSTIMTLRHSGLGSVDAKMKSDMETGWNESFDKLMTIVNQ